MFHVLRQTKEDRVIFMNQNAVTVIHIRLLMNILLLCLTQITRSPTGSWGHANQGYQASKSTSLQDQASAQLWNNFPKQHTDQRE